MGETVLVAVDGSPLSYRALRHAIEKFPDADIVTLTVRDIFEPWRGSEAGGIETPPISSDEFRERGEETTEAVLSEAEAIAGEYDRVVERRTESGDPQRLIPDIARDDDIDHIVLGVHGREEAERTLFGRVAETVVFRAPVSVTVIR